MIALEIARFTIKEAVRRRLVHAAILLSALFLVLFAIGFQYGYQQALASEGSRGRMPTLLAMTTLVILGLYAVNFMASFLSLFLSVSSISGEVDSGTLHAVLAHPISRGSFVLGRWLAYVLLILVYDAVMIGGVLAMAHWLADYAAADVPRAVGLIVLESIFLMSLSLFGSSALPTVANGVVTFSLYGLAWLAGIIELVGGLIGNQTMVTVGIVVSLIMPSDAIWRGASYYMQSPLAIALLPVGREWLPFASINPPTAALMLWTAGYIAILVAGAVAVFKRRDL